MEFIIRLFESKLKVNFGEVQSEIQKLGFEYCHFMRLLCPQVNSIKEQN